MKTAFIILGALVVLFLGARYIVWPAYKYDQCRKVGYSVFYCVMR